MSPRLLEVNAEVDVTVKMSVRIVGEHMTAQELGDLIAENEDALCMAIVKVLERCDVSERIGWTPDGNRPAFLDSISAVGSVQTGARYIDERTLVELEPTGRVLGGPRR